MTIGDIVTYTSPEIKLICSASVHKGVIKRISKSFKLLEVEDCEIEPGENKKYLRHIQVNQIIDIERRMIK